MNNVMMFTTSHCTECRPIKERIAAEGLAIELIDAEEHQYLAFEQNVMSVPTIIDGNDRFIGGEQCRLYIDRMTKEVR